MALHIKKETEKEKQSKKKENTMEPNRTLGSILGGSNRHGEAVEDQRAG